MRSIYLLYRDGRVTKHKKSIEKLKNEGLLNGVQYVLLPIASKKAVYLAVLGDFLNAEDFHKTTVRMHMRLMGGATPTYQDFPPWAIHFKPIFDYWTTTMEANTWEEFYHILHIAVTNCMVEYMQQGILCNTMHGGGYTGPIYFHRIQDLSIHCFDGEGKDINEPFEFSMGDYPYPDEIEDHLDIDAPPDEYSSGNAYLCQLLSERYGLYETNVIRGEMSIRQAEDGSLTWRKEQGNVLLFSDVKKVIISTGDGFSPFMMLTDDEYDQLARIDGADAYMIPLIYAPPDYDKQKPVYEYLTPTTCFNVPRYQFSDDNDSPVEFQNAIMMLDSYMGETIESYEFHEPQQVAFMIAYMSDLLEALCEACKVEAADRYETTDLLAMSPWCTMMVDIIVNLSEARPVDKYLHIMTDRYQDVPIDVKTMCYLLDREEKTGS